MKSDGPTKRGRLVALDHINIPSVFLGDKGLAESIFCWAFRRDAKLEIVFGFVAGGRFGAQTKSTMGGG